MPSSSRFLREQLRLRRAVEHQRLAAIGHAPSLGSEPLDYYLHESALRRIAKIENELVAAEAATNSLEFAFDGEGVFGHAITLNRLSALVQPIGQTLRWTARSIAVIDGDEPVPGSHFAGLIEPVLVGTAEGSFAIRIGRSPVTEQTSLLRGPLFDRTAERVMGLFRTARDTRDPAAVTEELFGLRRRALESMHKLGSLLAASTEPTRIRWRSEEVVAVTPSTAAVLLAALSNFTVDEESISVEGIMTGGDLTDERFHLLAFDEKGKRVHYRGNVEPELLSDLREVQFGSRVAATMTVITEESEWMTKPPSYVLSALRVIDAPTTRL